MSVLEQLLERGLAAKAALATAAQAVAEYNEAVATSASVLAERDRERLRTQLNEVHLETLAMSGELDAAIAAQLAD